MSVKAILWDFGGVITASPFEGFARYEKAENLPEGFIRKVNTINPDANAWARFERSEIDRNGFIAAFEDEAKALGQTVSGEAVLAGLMGHLARSWCEHSSASKTPIQSPASQTMSHGCHARRNKKRKLSGSWAYSAM